MANGVSGSVTATSNGHTIKIYYQETYTVATNKTDTFKITKVGITPNNRSDAFYVGGTIKVNGTTVATMSTGLGTAFSGKKTGSNLYTTAKGEEGILYLYSSGSWTQFTAQVSNIAHNNDGTKSINIVIEDLVLISTVSGTTRLSNFDKTWSVNLTNIPRAASISTASNTTLGNGCTITWTSLATSYYYRVRLEIGNWVYVSVAGDIPNNGGSSYSFTTPALPIEQIAKELPNSATGTVNVYLYTYSNSACTTQVGSRTNKTITVTIPSSVKPELTAQSLNLINTNAKLIEWGDTAVLGMTAIQISASAKGIYGSTISKIIISDGYSGEISGSSLSTTTVNNEQITNGSLTIAAGAITTSGSKTFTIQAVDSRGRVSASASLTQYICAYYPPEITVFTIARDDDPATNVKVKISWDNATMASHNNDCDVELKYKPIDNSSAEITYSGNVIQGNLFVISGFNIDKSYKFTLTITDQLGTSTTEELSIPTIAVTLDLLSGGNGMAVGKMCESENFEVAMNTIFMGEVTVKTSTADIILTDYIKGIIDGRYTSLTLEDYILGVVNGTYPTQV